MENRTIIINDKQFSYVDGQTILQVCKENNIYIPTLCYLKDICQTSNCRMCVVEGENGKLLTACSTKCVPGMNVKTDSEKVVASRKNTLEMLLSNHHFDCINCQKVDNCELQKHATYYGLVPFESQFKQTHQHKIDNTSPCIVRNNNKCILCGRCVSVCSNTQAVHALTKINRGFETKIGCAFDQNLAQSTCVGCGQCTLVCPTGALVEREEIDDVENLLANKDYFVVAQVAPSVRVALAEAFGADVGTFDEGKMVACIKALGFQNVFDINFGADLTTYAEATELLHRIENNKSLPQFSSCCPAWFKYVLNFYPEYEDNLSECKSPTEMLGAVLKHYYSKKLGIDKDKIKVVGIMPCTAKKGEKERAKDVDAVLCTRELSRMIYKNHINFSTISPCKFDLPNGDHVGGGILYGASGGVTESVLRYASRKLGGKNEDVEFEKLRECDGVGEYQIKCGTKTLSLCVVSGLANAKRVMDEIKRGEKSYHFMEVMACPGGCLNGGGQTWVDYNKIDVQDVKNLRSKSLYNRDHEITECGEILDRKVDQMYHDLLIETEDEKQDLFFYKKQN